MRLPCEHAVTRGVSSDKIPVLVPAPLVFGRVVADRRFLKYGYLLKLWAFDKDDGAKSFLFLIKGGNALIPYFNDFRVQFRRVNRVNVRNAV